MKLATLLMERVSIQLALVVFLGLGASLLVPTAAMAGEPATIAYGPLPDTRQQEYASAAPNAPLFEQADNEMVSADPRRQARGVSLLVSLGRQGLLHAATRLADGKAKRAETRARLLQVVASSTDPLSQSLLIRAASESRPSLRMIAASGLMRHDTPDAADALAILAVDPIAGVRVAAMRGLFSFASPRARALRIALPMDAEPDLLAKRLELHAQRGDQSETLEAFALRAIENVQHRALALGSAAYVVAPTSAVATPKLLAALNTIEVRGNAAAKAPMPTTVSAAKSASQAREAVVWRQALMDGVTTLLDRRDMDDTVRDGLIVRAVAWTASPIDMNPFDKRPIPEHRLRQRLPDEGARIVAPVLDVLRRRAYTDPREGVMLIRALGAKIALPHLHALLQQTPAGGDSYGRYTRVAAASAMRELGRIGNAAVARALVLDESDRSVRTDAIHTLAVEPSAWALDILEEACDHTDAGLRREAREVLEKRTESRAFDVLRTHYFKRPEEHGEERLWALVRGGAPKNIDVLRAALADPRRHVRFQALELFGSNRPVLRTRGVADIIQALPFQPETPSEIQFYLYALLQVDPMAAVTYVREHFEAFPTDRVRSTSLRQLSEVRGTPARHAAIDFALGIAENEHARPSLLRHVLDVMKGYWGYRTEEVTKLWRRMLASPAMDQEEVIRDLGTAVRDGGTVPDFGGILAPRFAAWKKGDDASERDDIYLAVGEDLLTALTLCPESRVHKLFMDVLLDPMQAESLRQIAVTYLHGKVTLKDRERIAAWLGVVPAEGKPLPLPPPPGRSDDTSMQWAVGQVLGLKADDALARRLLETLQLEIAAFHTPGRRDQLEAFGLRGTRDAHYEGRIRALARSVAETRHLPVVTKLVDMIFDARFLSFCRTCRRRVSRSVVLGGPAFLGREASPLAVLMFRSDEAATTGDVFPRDAFELVSQVKVLNDKKLAALLARALADLQATGRLADIPDVYLSCVRTNLRDRRTGRKKRASKVVGSYMVQTMPVDSALDYLVAVEDASDFGEEDKFEEAARAQANAVALIRRRELTMAERDVLADVEATALALQGAASVQAGDEEKARAYFDRAIARQRYAATTWNTVSWYQALSGFSLDTAEARAAHAATLEQRASGRISLNTADTWATVLLERGRPDEGLALIQERVPRALDLRSGGYHFLLARLLAATGQIGASRVALRNALIRDRTLIARAKASKELAPLRDRGLIEKEAARAAREREAPEE